MGKNQLRVDLKSKATTCDKWQPDLFFCGPSTKRVVTLSFYLYTVDFSRWNNVRWSMYVGHGLIMLKLTMNNGFWCVMYFQAVMHTLSWKIVLFPKFPAPGKLSPRKFTRNRPEKNKWAFRVEWGWVAVTAYNWGWLRYWLPSNVFADSFFMEMLAKYHFPN